MNCLKVSIHDPGLGKVSKSFGKKDRVRYGSASPSAIDVNTRRDDTIGKTSAAPRAGARNGAAQGVDITVANVPEKKEPPRPDFAVSLLPAPMKEVPNSNKPLRFKAKTSSKVASPKTKRGSCN